jgi:hypothetical protein
VIQKAVARQVPIEGSGFLVFTFLKNLKRKWNRFYRRANNASQKCVFAIKASHPRANESPAYKIGVLYARAVSRYCLLRELC